MLEITKSENVHIAKFANISRFNTVIAQPVRDELSRIVSFPGAKLVLDLDGIKFIDSSAFGALLAVLNTSRACGSTFKLCNTSPEISELIKVMQLDTVFPIVSSREECVKSFA